MSSARDLVKCEDMRIHAERARQFLGARSLAEFQADELVQAAVIRCIEVIGEAAWQVSADAHQRVPKIPWSLIIGMRNVLAGRSWYWPRPTRVSQPARTRSAIILRA